MITGFDFGRYAVEELKLGDEDLPGYLEQAGPYRKRDVLYVPEEARWHEVSAVPHNINEKALRPALQALERQNTAMWRDELPSATFASYLVRLVPDLQRVTSEYLVEWLMHRLVRQRVRSISTVAVQQVNANPSRLRELEIDLPVDLAEQRRIVATLEACDEQIGRENEELNKLRELKQGLVDDPLSGRVTASGLAA